jgi:hypothetical protein
MRYKKALQLTNSDFKRLYGVSKETYKTMIQEVAKSRLGKRGSPSKLLIPDQILLTLQYLRGAGDAPPPESIELSFIWLLTGEFMNQQHGELSKELKIFWSSVHRLLKAVPAMTRIPRVNSAKFRLPSQRQLQQAQTEIEVIVIDVAETEIERPKKASA